MATKTELTIVLSKNGKAVWRSSKLVDEGLARRMDDKDLLSIMMQVTAIVSTAIQAKQVSGVFNKTEEREEHRPEPRQDFKKKR